MTDVSVLRKLGVVGIYERGEYDRCTNIHIEILE
jgi:hypothetical protein